MQGRQKGRRYEGRAGPFDAQGKLKPGLYKKCTGVGNHLSQRNSVRVVDWQSYESNVENYVDEFKLAGAGMLGVREEV